MNKGALVPDRVVMKMVEGRLSEPDAAAVFSLTSFPVRSFRRSFLTPF